MGIRTTYIDLALNDTNRPEAGDTLASPRVQYRIIDTWPTESKIWPNRWTLRIRTPGETNLPPEPGKIRIYSTPYQPGEGPHEFFGAKHRDTETI